jgi:hypothetical protein
MAATRVLRRAVVAAGIACWAAMPVLAASTHGERRMLVPGRVDVPVVASPDGVGRMRKAILLAANRRMWQVVSERPGSLELRHVKAGKHAAIVRVEYDATGFQLHYVSSENLDYNPRGPTIHWLYNEWVTNLGETIRTTYALME